MSNVVDAFYQTLTAEFADAAKVFVGTRNLLKSIYWDVNPAEEGAIGQTINIGLPASVSGNVSDVGTNDASLSDVSFTTKSIVMNKHPQYAAVIRDFEQFNSPLAIRQVIVDAAFKGIEEYCNTQLVNAVNTTNFNSYGSGITTSGSYPSTAEFLTGLSKLANSKVPVDDLGNMSLVAGSTPYYGILGDSNWTQQNIASELIAERVRTTGQLRNSYGVDIKLDQQMPKTGSAGAYTNTCLLLHKYAIAAVSRKLPDPSEKVVDYTFFQPDGIPIRLMFGYNQLKLGWVLTVDAGFGFVVNRPECGIVFSCPSTT